MSAADGLDQPLSRSAGTLVAPWVAVNPRTRLTHRARSGHGGLFVPKSTRDGMYQHSYPPDLLRTVPGGPLVSVGIRGGCYSVSYSRAGAQRVSHGRLATVHARYTAAVGLDVEYLRRNLKLDTVTVSDGLKSDDLDSADREVKALSQPGSCKFGLCLRIEN